MVIPDLARQKELALEWMAEIRAKVDGVPEVRWTRFETFLGVFGTHWIDPDAFWSGQSLLLRSRSSNSTSAPKSKWIRLFTQVESRFGPKQLAVHLTPMKMTGMPEDIANGMLFLVSEESCFMSGLMERSWKGFGLC